MPTASRSNRGHRLLHAAVERGVTFFEPKCTARTPTNLLGQALAPYRDRLVIATVWFQDARTDADLDGAREASLKRLRTDHIDLFYQHRVDPNVPIEDVAGTVRDLSRARSATSACRGQCATVRRAHAVQPVAAVQSEYSLWWREPGVNCCRRCRSWASASCRSARWAAAS